VVASIFTTAGFNRSATSANEDTAGASVAADGFVPGSAARLAQRSRAVGHRASDNQPDEKRDGRREANRDDHEAARHKSIMKDRGRGRGKGEGGRRAPGKDADAEGDAFT
jgi:hypothetical protein